MGGDQASASLPAVPYREQRKEAETRSGCIERDSVGIAYRRPVVRTPQAISFVPDMPSKISGMGAAENISEDPADISQTDGEKRRTESGRVLH